MTERTNVSRNAFLAAGGAAVITFFALVWLGKAGERVHPRAREQPSAEKQVAKTTPSRQSAAAKAKLEGLDEDWTPTPEEFVKLVSPVTVHNPRGKIVKQFPAGKRLRVSKREGNDVTINYLGDEYTIAAASTAPSP